MSDTLTAEERSHRMGLIRSQNTRPELLVRRLLHRLGYRYRLHRRDLPGTPDLAFPRERKAVFVHGCFWHRHSLKTCKLARLPKSRLDFWATKLNGNRIRDQRKEEELRNLGWEVLVVWECETADRSSLSHKLVGFLERDR